MSQRPKLNRVWTSLNHALRRDPGDEKYRQGWLSEIPTFQVLNYLQYKSDIALLSLAERGIFEWGDDVQYQLGSVTWDEADRRIYVAVVNKPSKTKRPSMNPGHWSPSAIQVSRLDYDTVVGAINKHIEDVTGNPHRLTAGRLNAYTKDEIDIILEQYRVLVANHANDTNNPHKTKAVDIGAVAISGGTYTGDVIFSSQSIYFDSRKVSSITSKNDGIWQVRGEYAIGVGDDGVAKTGKFGSMSNLITEEDFNEVKYSNTKDFSVPFPTFKKLFVRDTNIQFGSDESSGTLEPDFSKGFAAITSEHTKADWNYPGPLNGTSGLTISLEVFVDSGGSSNSAELFVQAGDCRLTLQSDGKVAWNVRVGEVLTSTESIVVGAWNTVVGTYDGNLLSVFINGKPVGTMSAASTTLVADHIGISARASNPVRNWGFRNLTAWRVALSPKQVSNI